MYIIVHPPKVWRAYIANAMKPFINYVQSEGVRWNQPKAYTTMIGSCDKCKSVLKLLDRIKSSCSLMKLLRNAFCAMNLIFLFQK